MDNKEKILGRLNPNQKKAVLTVNGPILILAGAGSGKTRCIVHRIAYLTSVKYIHPYNILAVTFTNKAAGEMKERLENYFSISTHRLWIGTFHSICARILRNESQYLPFSNNYTIFDEDDQKTIIKKIIKKNNVSTDNFPPKKVLSIISKYKNNLMDYKKIPGDNSYYTKTIISIWKAYSKYLLDNNGLDFADLLFYTVELFKNNKSVLKKYQKQFKYIMIDEYQDTNFAQYQFAKLLAKSHKNICVVGDDDQSIYSWRGADIRNILSFEKDYPDTKIINLAQNYRSPQKILSAANKLILNNKHRHEKKLWTSKALGKKIVLFQLQNEQHEAILVSNKIQELRKKNVEFKDIAIFYRTNVQSRIFETEFIKNNINYRIIGGINFYQRKEIKDILSYLRVIANPDDNESLLRIINFPKRGIGKITISKLIDYAADQRYSLYNTLKNINEADNLSKSCKFKLNKFFKLLKKYQRFSLKEPIAELIVSLVEELKLIDILKNEELVKGETRADNIKEFLISTKEFTENYYMEFKEYPLLPEYLQNISLLTSQDKNPQDTNVVSLMTMHNAKGLEFPYVFVTGLEDGLVPHRNSLEEPEQIEEERRLLYVSITRTIKELFLTMVESRRFYNSSLPCFPSRFLAEIPDKYIEKYTYKLDSGSFQKNYIKPNTKKFDWKTNIKKYKVGEKIFHPKFGKGLILSVRKEGKMTKLTISFENGELKKILARYVNKL